MKKRDGARTALGEIDERYIEEAGTDKLESSGREQTSSVKPRPWLQITLAAAGVLLILWLGTTQILKMQEQPVSPEQSESSSESIFAPEKTTAPTKESTVPESLIIPEETVRLKIFDRATSFLGVQKGWFAEILKERFNIEIEIVNGYEQGVDTGVSGDIILWAAPTDEYREAIEKGCLLDWNQNDLLSVYGADIIENLSGALEANAQENGGVVYGFTGSAALPDSPDSDALINTWDIRWDLYDMLGRPQIDDLDDLAALLKAMKELEPVDDQGRETYALGMWPDWDDCAVMYVRALASAYYGYSAWGMGLCDTRTGNVHGALEEDGAYYTALRFMNQLYREGLLDPASRTQSYEEVVENMGNGKYFFSLFNYAGQDIYNTEEHINENRMLCALIPNEAVPFVWVCATSGMGYTWTIGSQTEYPELCMALINWLSTPEGALTRWYGPQGGCWDYDEEGSLYLTELGSAAQTDMSRTDMSPGGYSGTFGEGALQLSAHVWMCSSLIPNDPKGQTFLYTYWDSAQQEPCCEAEASWREYTGETLSTMYLFYHENAVYCEAVQQLKTPGREYSLYEKWELVAQTIVNGSWDCIYAQTEEDFELLWEQMSSAAREYGYEECVDYMQKQADICFEGEQKSGQ